MPGVASLREGFEHFYPPDDDAVAAALRTGLVSADTNVLLNLYRFQAGAREQLFGALEFIGDRLWIPHQVALEFHRNRLGVIADQEIYFSKTGESLDTAVKEYLSRLRAFTKRVALSPARAGGLEEMIQKAHQAVKDEVSAAGQANEIHLDNRDSDEVLRRLETLFNGRVGEPMTPAELEAARNEATRRARATPKIPPGYMDMDKPDGSGDYILWRQLINEARQRKLPVILITEDRKEDWIWREHGQTLGARYELREEMKSEAGVPFLLMTTETFLIQAEKYLDITVSPETVSQAAGLTASAAERHSAQQEIERNMMLLGQLDGELARINDHLGIYRRLATSLDDHATLTGSPDASEATQTVRREIDQLTARQYEVERRREQAQKFITLSRARQAESEVAGSNRVDLTWNYDPPESTELSRGPAASRISLRALSRGMPRTVSAAGCRPRRAARSLRRPPRGPRRILRRAHG